MNDITIQDHVKRLYQRYFGGGHMIADPAASLARLREECASLAPATDEALFEPIGGGICRMHLRPLLHTGLSLDTANAMFVYSANHVTPDTRAFTAALDTLAQSDADRAWIADYRAKGCPAISHSDAYRAAHAPAYRVVLDVFAKAFPLILRMDRLGSGLVSIDGPCASGKSTLAPILGEVFGASVMHMDDFFLQPFQRTSQRLAEPGGNFDRERFAAEVLPHLLAGEDFTFRPYNCAHQVIGAPVSFHTTPVTIVEGVYSQHPDLRDAYALRAFMEVDPQAQRERLLARNGPQMLQRFVQEWIPMENAYFDAFDIAGRSDVRIRL